MTIDEPPVEVVDPGGIGWTVEPVAALVVAVLDAERASGSLVVAFVDESRMTELNTRYRLPEATDVLSFRTGDETAPWPGDSVKQELGEVIICPAVVRRYAIEEGVSEAEQLAWTLIHGVLHLLGYDHETDEGEMRAREKDLLCCLAPAVDRLH